ncbi:DUF883 family protein [Ampullimonas aquatilis]|uniref:DUF883 family protein n=1 Tax=Ampullimonas aquatilis TaxID=1341549 RepID=UPI003C745C3A
MNEIKSPQLDEALDNAAETASKTEEALRNQYQRFIGDVEELLAQAEKTGGEGFEKLKEEFSSKLQSAKATFTESKGPVLDRIYASADKVNDYVHANPWKTAGIAAAVGVVVGTRLILNVVNTFADHE